MNKRAKKGKSTRLPSSLSEIKTTNLSNLTASTQRRLLVALNREANKRLQNIAEELNTKGLKPTVLQEHGEFKRIIENKNGYRIGPRMKFTATKNLPKASMEEQIRQRVRFLESNMTVTKATENRGAYLPTDILSGKKHNINETYATQQAELLKVFGKTFTSRALTQDQLERLGKLLNKARKQGFLGETDEAYIYLKDYQKVKTLLESKEYVSIDRLLDTFENELNEKIDFVTKQQNAIQTALEEGTLKGVSRIK